ncbi:MAG: HAD-IIA family hydrolase [Oscillospiraceae bacterium]|nr:HAD-IIA family hydrolase [Oscillospiraceae bacterium]
MLQEKRLFLFDIDGTVALGDTLFDGSAELFAHIRAIGGRSVFITNNSTKSRRAYVEKFAKWNIETDESDFITASYATCLHLKNAYAGKKVFVLGTRSFVRELREFGIDATTRPEPDVACVVAGFDDELTYQKVMDACEVLQTHSVDFLATNPDLRCPYSFGFIPDCGAICRMISATVDREPMFIGKPDRRIVDLCLAETGFSRAETLVVGDRLYTDILCGVNAGAETCLLLTGEATREDADAEDYHPDYIFENVKKLLGAVKGE